MGECIISRRSGGFNTKSAPPILNNLNPMDGEIDIRKTESITLSVFVEENNIDCTYQWFVNDAIVIGANGSIFEYVPEDTYATNIVKCAVTNSAGTTYSREASILVWPTKWYVIKNSVLVDNTAIFSSPYSNVKFNGSKIYTTKSTGSSAAYYAEILCEASTMYKNTVGISFINYNNTISNDKVIMVRDKEYTTGNWMNSGTTRSISTITPPIVIEVAINTPTNGVEAYVNIQELYFK